MMPLAEYVRKSGQYRVLFDDPYNDPNEGEGLEFRLTYEGPLMGGCRPGTIARSINTQFESLFIHSLSGCGR
jgi:hypothetical protein